MERYHGQFHAPRMLAPCDIRHVDLHVAAEIASDNYGAFRAEILRMDKSNFVQIDQLIDGYIIVAREMSKTNW